MMDLGNSFQHMGFVQLALLFGFITAYVLALGRLLGAAARLRCALLALVLCAAFASNTTPWEHGALLIAFVVAAMALYMAMVWTIASVVAPRGVAAADRQDEPDVASAAVVARVAARSVPNATETVARALR